LNKKILIKIDAAIKTLSGGSFNS